MSAIPLPTKNASTSSKLPDTEPIRRKPAIKCGLHQTREPLSCLEGFERSEPYRKREHVGGSPHENRGPDNAQSAPAAMASQPSTRALKGGSGVFRCCGSYLRPPSPTCAAHRQRCPLWCSSRQFARAPRASCWRSGTSGSFAMDQSAVKSGGFLLDNLRCSGCSMRKSSLPSLTPTLTRPPRASFPNNNSSARGFLICS